MEDKDLYRLATAIMDCCQRLATKPDKALQKELIRILRENYRLYKEDAWHILMSIRGLALRQILPLSLIIVLGEACRSASEESSDPAEKAFFGRSAGNLKAKTCEIFRGPLSGGEVFFSNGTKQRHSLTKLPEDVRANADARYTISRMNTQAILAAYSSLIQRAQTDGNELMDTHWNVQRRAFVTLLEHVAPKLLEPAPENAPAH